MSSLLNPAFRLWATPPTRVMLHLTKICKLKHPLNSEPTKGDLGGVRVAFFFPPSLLCSSNTQTSTQVQIETSLGNGHHSAWGTLCKFFWLIHVQDYRHWSLTRMLYYGTLGVLQGGFETHAELRADVGAASSILLSKTVAEGQEEPHGKDSRAQLLRLFFAPGLLLLLEEPLQQSASWKQKRRTSSSWTA